MTDIRTNIFGIGEVYELQKEGQWISKNRESYREFGYFLGISAPLNRLDYSNDTTTTNRRVASINQYYSGGAGNSNFGYIMGGNKSGSNSITDINRIDYSNDTGVLSRGGLTIGRYFTGATGNSNFGYIAGGYNNIIVHISTIERINYSNDNTTASIRGRLTIARGVIGTGNSNFGYFGGNGQAPTGGSTVDRIDYSNDSATSLSRGNIQNSNFSFSATGNNNFGYFLTGWGTSSSHRLNYANDTALLSIRGSLSFPKFWYPGSAGNSNFGYSAGGSTTSSQGLAVSTIDRIDYSNDLVVASVRGPLSNVDLAIAATSSASFGGSPVSYLGAPWTSTAPYGYFGGGFSSVAVPVVDRLDYSNDTLNALSRGGIITRYDNMAVGNNNFGYFGGGTPGISSVDRIDYSNDTQTASVRGPLSSGRGASTATGNSNFGYIGGGFIPSGPPIYYSTTDRINYSNDTAVASIRGPLSSAKTALAATSPLGYGGAPIYFTNPLPEVLQKQIIFNDANTLDLPFKRVLGSYGYFAGGGVPFPFEVYSTVIRIDYSNDTSTGSNRGNLCSNQSTFASVSNTNFGYIVGTIFPGTTATINRINYSNDSSVSLLRGSSSSEYFVNGVSSDNYGYIVGGGNAGVSTKNIQRLDYSNDSLNTTSRGSLATETGRAATTSNKIYGYVGGGGGIPEASPRSFVNRINFSNDTSTASVRGPLSLARLALAATGNSNFGYFGGGSPGPISRVDRIDYSNDTSTASVRGPLSVSRSALSATGSSNFGYFGGGSGPFSRVDRIDFSNDTQTASVRGSLSAGRAYLAATTNARSS